jgi:anti-sigma regulatory factor (Ser/Thr protein kinase)
MGTRLGTGGLKLTVEKGSVIGLKLRNDPAATRRVRAAVDRAAEACRLPAEERFELKLAATEAVTNALRMGAQRGPVEVSVACREDSVDVNVSAPAPFTASRTADDRRLEGERGRGIALMIALVDEIEFARTPEGTRVRMRKRRAPAGEGDTALA